MTEAGSKAAKQHWKKITPEARAASLAPLDTGRKIKRERYHAERREWDAIKLRADGASLKEIAKRFGFGDSRKRVRSAVRSVDLPAGKCYVLDRGRPYKRETGVAFYKSLSLPPADFARLISTSDHPVQAKRVSVIWFTNGTKNLDPLEARACRALRGKIAANLLAQDSRKEFGPDRFSRQQMLVTLYPRLHDEYQLLRCALPNLREFFGSNPDAGEAELAAFALETAQNEKKEKSESRIFRELVRWLAEGSTTNSLIPAILGSKALIAGDEVNNRVAVEVLARTLPVPSGAKMTEIVRHAISKGTKPISPGPMRVFLRVHIPELFSPVQAIAPASKVKPGHAKGWMTPLSEKRIRLAAALWCFGLNRYRIAATIYSTPSTPNLNTKAYDKYRSLIEGHTSYFDKECSRLTATEAQNILRVLVLEK